MCVDESMHEPDTARQRKCPRMQQNDRQGEYAACCRRIFLSLDLRCATATTEEQFTTQQFARWWRWQDDHSATSARRHRVMRQIFITNNLNDNRNINTTVGPIPWCQHPCRCRYSCFGRCRCCCCCYHWTVRWRYRPPRTLPPHLPNQTKTQ